MRKIPLFWISLAVILGIVAASVLPFERGIWKLLALVLAGCVPLEILVRKKRASTKLLILPISLILLMFTVGGWRYQVARFPDITPNQLVYYNNQGKINLVGHICADPQYGDTTVRLVVCVQEILEPSRQNIDGKVMVFLKSGTWRYGDQVELFGSITTPFETEDFSYKEYLAQRGITSVMSFPWVDLIERDHKFNVMRGLFSIRHAAYEKIQQFYPQPEAGLLSGILLGIETDIPGDLKNAFQNTGTDHIIAISGFNMTILAGIFLKGFRKWLTIWWAAFFAVLTIGLYTILVGAAPAVVRAAVMGGLAISASLIGRGQSGKYTLILTAAVMCVINPLLLWNAGFQLSVMATLGLVLYAGRLLNWFTNVAKKFVSEERAEKITNLISEYILFTLAAQLTTLPILLYHFEQVSLISLLANPLILPVQPITMILGGIAVITGLLIPPLGQLLSYVVWIFLFYTNQVVSWLAEISSSSFVVGELPFLGVMALYVLIFFLTYKSNQLVIQSLKKPVVMLAGIMTAIVLVWNAVLLRPDDRLHIWVMEEANQGAVFLKTPSGKKILINTGELANPLSSELGKHLPASNRKVDLAIATGLKEKNYQAFSKILERFYIPKFVWIDSVPLSRSANEINAILKEKDSDIRVLRDGEKIDCGDGVVIENYNQQYSGVALLLTYQELRFVVMDEELSLPEENQILDGAIVLSHSDDIPPLTEQKILPQLLIHHQIEANDETPGQISTDTVGKIEIITDGSQLWINGEK